MMNKDDYFRSQCIHVVTCWVCCVITAERCVSIM